MKMSNFLEFVEEDIDAKKTLISTMPTNNKRNIKKFNNKIDTIHETYVKYKDSVKKYIETKSKSFKLKPEEKILDDFNEKIKLIEEVKFILNPSNTYFEKMGFDNLVYQISHYADFDFEAVIEIINKFLDKFESAGIKLSKNDFNYTFFVNEYMTALLEERSKKSNDYKKVAEIFEKIYWTNPEIIEHIELNFKKLIKKNERYFVNYISKLQKELLDKNKIKNYDDCQEKLKEAYNQLNEKEKENITNIVESAKSGTIDITNYFKDSKFRNNTFSTLLIDSSELENKEFTEKLYDNLKKLKVNIKEYINYNKFLPLVDDFKLEYEKNLKKDTVSNDRKIDDKKPINQKGIESQIIELENKLERINRKVFGKGLNIFGQKNDTERVKLESIKEAKKIYELYKESDEIYFKKKVFNILSNTMTIADMLHLYYSFDLFKKNAIKRVFNIAKYDELLKYSEEFDKFAMNPTNIIVNSIDLFGQSNITKIIMNKYRLANINLNDENLNPDDLNELLGKIEFLLRIETIENSETNVDKIWFISQVEKINRLEDKKE